MVFTLAVNKIQMKFLIHPIILCWNKRDQVFTSCVTSFQVFKECGHITQSSFFKAKNTQVLQYLYYQVSSPLIIVVLLTQSNFSGVFLEGSIQKLPCGEMGNK
uniref:Uncharacterized protein n=1 Tax=Micrurus spixii TaxID=129469 RepID=A0A2D4M1I1_9SAUR